MATACVAAQTRLHDVHHWYLNANYYQYCVFWDWVLGTYKPYPQPADAKAADETAAAQQSEAGGVADVPLSGGKRSKVA